MERNGNIIAFPERRVGIRIGDLSSGHYIQVTCRHCNHMGRVYLERLWRRYPMATRVVDLVRRLRCQECGGRGAAKWDIWRIDRNA